MAKVQFIKRQSTKHIIIHCSATRPSMDIGVREIRQWHKRDNGWLDVGYHFVIKRDGSIEIGRQINQVGAHTKGFNSTSIGICLVGGVNEKMKPEDNFTPAQFAALKGLVASLKEQFPDALSVKGHRDFDPKKACPSFDVASLKL